MPPESVPPERTYRHVVEQPTLRRVVEHFTLLTLLLAVSLYAIGQFQSWRYISSFGIPSVGVERGWETYVFIGAVAVMNLVLSPGLASLRWFVPLALLVAVWMLRARVSRREPGRLRALLLPALTTLIGVVYVGLLVMIGIAWGLQSAHYTQDVPAPQERYVLTPDAQALMPAAFQDANAKGALRYIAAGTDSVFVYDPATRQTFAVPNRLIVCRVFDTAR
jgi:hypothetical protein